LVAELYENMGYDIELTKKTHDNGIDIIATNNDIAKKEKILIQCKKTQKNITVKDIREFTGIIELNNATKGAFYTTSDYTSFAKKILITYNRLEMINGKEIIKLFNAHLDSNWPIKIGTISQKYRRKN
jgi:restriction system protein